MKKRISILLLTFVLTLSLFGCGSESKELSDYDVESMEYTADMLIQSFAVMTEEDFERLQSYSDFELQYTIMASGFSIDADDFLVMMESWQNATKEYGAFVDYEDYTVELADTGGVVLTTDILYENQEAILVLNFSEEGRMTDLVVNIEYTMGEILEKAGLNTLLGMGTVFAVLIFIAFIISLFRFIPAIEGLFGKKKKEEKKPVAKEKKETPASHASPLVHIMNDAELVAIIAAAIAAAEGTTPDGFVVRSIKRRKTNHWK